MNIVNTNANIAFFLLQLLIEFSKTGNAKLCKTNVTDIYIKFEDNHMMRNVIRIPKVK